MHSIKVSKPHLDGTKSGTIPVRLAVDVITTRNKVEVERRAASRIAPLGSNEVEAKESTSGPAEAICVASSSVTSSDKAHVSTPSWCWLIESEIDSILNWLEVWLVTNSDQTSTLAFKYLRHTIPPTSSVKQMIEMFCIGNDDRFKSRQNMWPIDRFCHFYSNN